jgi:UMF1 family MFS transporter
LEESERRRARWAWALYDVGNSAFYLTIVAAVFPVFYQSLYVKKHAVPGADEAKLVTQGGSALAFTATVAMVVVAVLGPVLGAVADRTAVKKKLLAGFAALGAASCLAMLAIGEADVGLASVLYALGTIGVAGSIVFYDALLPSVAREEELDRVSTLGFAAGYLGSVVLFVAQTVLLSKPELLGLRDAAQAARWSFASVGIWWTLFTIPILRLVPEPPVGKTEGSVLLAGFRQLGSTLRKLPRHRVLLLFLLAYWVYSDGIGTIIKLAAPFGNSLGVKTPDLMKALVLTQLVGVPCALAFGRIARRTGAKAAILAGLLAYAAICVSAAFMTKTWHFTAMAVSVGFVQGGTQALSRSLFATLVPRGQTTEFFGFFSTMEKFAGILGPLVLALLWKDGGDPRRGILAIAAFFVAGAAILWRVDVEAGRKAAQAC